jgi:hypothetical protein
MHGLSPPLNLSALVEEKQKWKMKDEGMNILLTHNKLFIGPNRGQNSVHGLPLKWAPTFLVTFLLLPNSRVRIYVNSTKIMSVRRNGGKSKQLPKLVSMGCDGLTPWSAGGGSLVPTPW